MRRRDFSSHAHSSAGSSAHPIMPPSLTCQAMTSTTTSGALHFALPVFRSSSCIRSGSMRPVLARAHFKKLLFRWTVFKSIACCMFSQNDAGGHCRRRHRRACRLHVHRLHLPRHIQLLESALGHQGEAGCPSNDCRPFSTSFLCKPSAFMLDLVGQGCGAAIPSLRAGELC
jgi:hypothetical protein